MSHSSLVPYQFKLAAQQASPTIIREPEKFSEINYSPSRLAEKITRESSSQTYLTIGCLADRQLVRNAYRAYAYFRWVDDVVDQDQVAQTERLDFLARQQEIIACSCRGDWPLDLCAEERLVADLIHSAPTANSGLHIYINQMMAVMVFDAKRRDQIVSQEQLDEYTLSLATAVTEALHYFIGHHDRAPYGETRYSAVTGAHITHMLRDAIEDTAVGYYNIPQEYLDQHNLLPTDIHHDAYCAWVRQRVQLARDCFALGRTQLVQVENLRCRLAGYAYIARFEVVLDAIEKDGYRLRSAYPERKSKKAALKMGLAALWQTAASSLEHKHSPTPGSFLGEQMP